jgi:phage terminase large subunit-like protein
MTAAERYAKEVLEGKIVVGKLIKSACQRFVTDLEREDLFFDEKEASRAVNFIERKLRHWEGAFGGRPLKLEDWQKFIVMQIFGWFTLELHPSGVRLRRVRSVYIQIARKNGKTAFLAAIILYHILADREGTPQVLVGANNEDQAKICTNSVGQMVLASPELRDLYDDGELKLFNYNGKIFGLQYPEKIGEMRAMSKNPETKDGYGASLGGVDEYHEAKDDKLLNVIESGQGSRINPLLIVITTAGFDKDGPCYSKLRESSVQILNDTIQDDHHLAFIYEQDEEDKVSDESTWVKSNPNLGVSVNLDFLRTRYKKALNEGGTKMVDFLTKNLNKWVDAPEVWIPNEVWKKCRHGLTIDDLEGMDCYGGLDLARTVDLNAFALWFPKGSKSSKGFILPVHAVLLFFWIPEDKMNNNNDRVDYIKWVDQKYIFKTPGNTADYSIIAADIKGIVKKFNFKSLAYDKYLMGHGTLKDLIDNMIECHEMAQNIVNLNFPTKELERIVHSFEFEHFGNPVLNWMMGNVILAKDTSGNVKPDKGKSEKKIDGVSAMINALAEFKTFENQQIDLTFTAIK